MQRSGARLCHSRMEQASIERDVEWQAVKRRIDSAVVAFEKQLGPQKAHGFELTSDERGELERLTALPPATRNFSEVHRLLNILQGSDLLLQLDDDQQAAVANAMRWEVYEKGAMVATETNASDGFLLLVVGQLSILIRDTSVRSLRTALRHMYAGECFAERLLIEQSKSMPSLVAAEEAVVLRVARADFFAAHTSWQMELVERKVAALCKAPCLMGVDRRLLRPLADRMSLTRHHANQVVIAQGDESTRLYCIGSGECRVLMRIGDGRTLEIATLGPGDIFGEIGVMSDRERTASVVSSSDVMLYSLMRSDLFTMADAFIIEQLREQAGAYPPESSLVEQLALGSHWSAYKHTLLGTTLDQAHASRRQLPFGSRPTPPAALPPSALAGGVVRRHHHIATDGTPLSRLDLRDLHAGTTRRQADSCKPQPSAYLAAHLSVHLSTRPGGEEWRGNAKLREYVRCEEERERERARARRMRSGRRAVGGRLAAIGSGDVGARHGERPGSSIAPSWADAISRSSTPFLPPRRSLTTVQERYPNKLQANLKDRQARTPPSLEPLTLGNGSYGDGSVTGESVNGGYNDDDLFSEPSSRFPSRPPSPSVLSSAILPHAPPSRLLSSSASAPCCQQ